MTRKEIQAILDHERDCPRKHHGAAECLCQRSSILEVLADNGRGV